MKSKNIRRAAQTNRVTPGTARPTARRRTASQPRHYWDGDVLSAVTAALLKTVLIPSPAAVTPGQAPPTEPGMIILGISRLLAACLLRPHPPGHATGWLNWLRRYQARSRWYHQHARLARDGGITLVS